MTTPSKDKKLHKAFGVLGFPLKVLLGSVRSAERAEPEKVLRARDIGHHFFSDVEEYDEELSPAIFPRVAELVFNEGIILRKLREELTKGRLIVAVNVDSEDAPALADLLYRNCVDKICYFDSYSVSQIHPQEEDETIS